MEGMLGAICIEVRVERKGFGEEGVYRGCKLSPLGVVRPEFGQRPCRMSTLTPTSQGWSLGFQAVGFGRAIENSLKAVVEVHALQPLAENLRRVELFAVKPHPQCVTLPSSSFCKNRRFVGGPFALSRIGDGPGDQKTVLEILLLALRCRPSAGMLSWP